MTSRSAVGLRRGPGDRTGPLAGCHHRVGTSRAVRVGRTTEGDGTSGPAHDWEGAPIIRFRPGKRWTPGRNVRKVITVRDAYLQAATSAAEQFGRPAVADAWNGASALAEFRVSGLAGHLAHQVLTVPAVLGNEVPDGSLIGLLDHYSSVTWRSAGVDDEINVGIRAQGEQHATDGPTALAERVAGVAVELAAHTASTPIRRNCPTRSSSRCSGY
jgi:hypothetical protein